MSTWRRYVPARSAILPWTCLVPLSSASFAATTRLSSSVYQISQHSLHHTPHYCSVKKDDASQVEATVPEERVTRWCRRLRSLQERAQTHSPAPAVDMQITTSTSNVAATAKHINTTTNTSSASANTEASAELSLLHEWTTMAHSQHDRTPAVMVERVWAVYDAILPRHIRHSATLQDVPERCVDNFFRFIHLVLSNDVDVSAVESVSAALQHGLQRYHAVRDELATLERGYAQAPPTRAAKTSDCTDQQRQQPREGQEDDSGRLDRRKSYTMQRDTSARYADLNRLLVEAKQSIMKGCLDAHKAGAPLHYRWLRHTAGMESGVRRLMHFRNTLDAFQRMCRQEITALHASRRHRTQVQEQQKSQRIRQADELPTLRHTALKQETAGRQQHVQTNKMQQQQQGEEPQKDHHHRQQQTVQQDERSSHNPRAHHHDQEDVVEEQYALTKWLQREREVSTVSGVCTLLFQDFFSTEYLVMEELTWSTTPPSLLQQVMSADTVQPCLGGLSDLQYRMQPTAHRHLYAFLHPAVVEEPLMAVQVALTAGIECSVDVLLRRRTPLADAQCRCAAAALFRRQHPEPVHCNTYLTHSKNYYSEDSVELARDSKKGNDYSGILSRNNHDGATSANTSYHNDKIDTAEVDTAMFYSINSGQSSLRGLDLGNMLIKRAVREIRENLNAVRCAAGHGPIVQFSTLSPIPGYMRWLAAEVEKLRRRCSAQAPSSSSSAFSGLFAQDRIFGSCAGEGQSASSPSTTGRSSWVETHCWEPLRRAAIAYGKRHAARRTSSSSSTLHATEATAQGSWREAWAQLCDVDRTSASTACIHALTMEMLWRLWATPNNDNRRDESSRDCIASDSDAWWLDHDFTAAVEQPLLRSVAHYLYVEKRRNRMLDSVGNFHVGNGATLYRLNFLANTTPQGSRESACVMVNYRYDLPSMAARAVAYEVSHTISATPAVTDLLKCDKSHTRMGKE